MNAYGFDAHGRFVLPDYADASPFSSFLPGIAGAMGIPMWVFYVNRGQAIAGFGVESKDTPIMEFQPANKAYQATAFTGFRTFIKRGDAPCYEPFSPTHAAERQMHIGMNELELYERAPEQQLDCSVLYFTLTEEPFAGLVRCLTITNTGSEPAEISLLDGLPVVIPYGVTNAILKELPRTAEAWMAVFNVETGIPFFRLQASIADKVEVVGYEAGHFYAAFTKQGRLSPLVDPAVIFGQNTTLTQPDRFLTHSLDELYQQKQITVCKTPCAFFGAEQTVSPGGSLTVYSVIGHVGDVNIINREARRLCRASYITKQRQRARDLVSNLTDAVAIKTSRPILDAYTRQTFLDNVMRGGWPVLIGDPERPFVQHIFSRKHGDMERDYNSFYLAPECYSQGDGNYRDINQNRREDVWLNPRVGDYDITTFMNLIQADGYNPLVIYGNRYVVPADKLQDALAPVNHHTWLAAFLTQPFTPGELLKRVALQPVKLRVSPEAFLSHVLSYAEQRVEIAPGEGYWVDHWTYNLDLIEKYLAIYPERKRHLLFEQKSFTFYDNPAVVCPRDQKYVLVDGRVRQMQAIVEDEDKQRLIASRTDRPTIMRSNRGEGEIFYTSLYVKLICLALNKFASMDPSGMGIEMEAGKPGWYDALNGLPGLFGSSMPETFELVRLLRFLIDAANEASDHVVNLPIELYNLLSTIKNTLDIYQNSSRPDRDMLYWDSVAAVRETYRDAVRLGFSGQLEPINLSALVLPLSLFLDKVQAGINRARELNDGIPPTYFMHEVEDYAIINGQAAEIHPAVRVTRFKPVKLPLFLEGPVRLLKILDDPQQAGELYRQVKASPLFDDKLNMYKVNASLGDLPLDIGRARAFTPGWLENESIWLHMAYKYLLSTLEAGLTEAFFADFQDALVPFQKPEIYGRSPLENSSFIVSSAHPDETLHGRGFVARLSGSTAEFLSILHRMMIGKQPFFVEDGQLRLAFRPDLPQWLFDADDTVSFTFLGTCRVIYHNPDRRNTFGENAAVPRQYILEPSSGDAITVDDSVLGEPYAGMVRGGQVTTIRVLLT